MSGKPACFIIDDDPDIVDPISDLRSPISCCRQAQRGYGKLDVFAAAQEVALRAGIDVDQDGVANGVDNCLYESNLNQRDTDSNSIGNACDPDVAVPNDCIVNFLDLNVYRTNFFQPGDLDTDNTGDGQTNFLDLNFVREYFFRAPGPGANGCN